jgi:hypothetical protein
MQSNQDTVVKLSCEDVFGTVDFVLLILVGPGLVLVVLFAFVKNCYL